MTMCLRWIDNPNHAGLAMADLTAVEPKRGRVVDGQSEDGALLNLVFDLILEPWIHLPIPGQIHWRIQRRLLDDKDCQRKLEPLNGSAGRNETRPSPLGRRSGCPG